MPKRIEIVPGDHDPSPEERKTKYLKGVEILREMRGWNFVVNSAQRFSDLLKTEVAAKAFLRSFRNEEGTSDDVGIIVVRMGKTPIPERSPSQNEFQKLVCIGEINLSNFLSLLKKPALKLNGWREWNGNGNYYSLSEVEQLLNLFEIGILPPEAFATFDVKLSEILRGLRK